MPAFRYTVSDVMTHTAVFSSATGCVVSLPATILM